MAIKARETITIIKERDINATWRFYRIASSSSTPSQPTEAQGKAYVNSQTLPTGWSVSEPAYDGTSTNSLYTCDLTSFTDGEVSWSSVSKASSYEAAKQAYNEAQVAKKTATDYMQTVSGGVWVTPSDKKPDANGNAISSTRGVRITDVVDIYRGTDSVAQFGDAVRVGQEGAGKTRTILSENGMQVKQRATPNYDVLIAHIGYGEGASATGVLANPYYVFGFKSGSGAPGNYSFNTGFANKTEGYASYAHGLDCEVTGGLCGTASGMFLKTEKALQTVIGVANAIDTTTGKRSIQTGTVAEDDMGKYAFVIGNGELRQPIAFITGEDDILRSNAFTVDWDGNVMALGMAGMIQMFAGPTAPAGWLICDGSAISRTEYERLYSVIGTRWGSGDGSTTFNIPDLRGRAPIGAGTGKSVDGASNLTARTLGTKISNSESVTLAAANMPNHRHGTSTSGGRFLTQPGTTGVGTVRVAAASSGSNYVPKSSSNVDFAGADYTAYAPGSAATAHNNMQPSTVVNFIICTGKTS